MLRKFLFKFFISALSIGFGSLSLYAAETKTKVTQKKTLVYVIPIKGEISNAQFYIVRRGLKQAVQNNINSVVLKIDTPGGALDTTLKIMEILENFNGDIISFIDKEAISAGAYIASSTSDIYFHSKGVLGAAAVIQSTGEDVQKTLKQKIDSYLRAKIRTHTKNHRYRADVVRAMMDIDYQLEIDGKVIKAKGELLTLTADEAMMKYGKPPVSIFGAGIADSVDAILNSKYGEGNYIITNFELSSSEYLARWLNAIAPILMGLGMLLLFIEFKTPGFGMFGIGGIALLFVVFASSYIAGLAGYEPVFIFMLGIVLLGVEFFIFPGIMILGMTGVLLIFGTLIWSLADIWPGKEMEFSFDIFKWPILEVFTGLLIAVVGILILGKFVYKTWFLENLVLKTTVASVPGQDIPTTRGVGTDGPKIGDIGIVTADLHPTGEVEINSLRYQARVSLGIIDKGTSIVVTGKEEFALIVRELKK